MKRSKWLGDSRATKADKQKKARQDARGKNGPVARRSHGQGQEKKRLPIRSRAAIGVSAGVGLRPVSSALAEPEHVAWQLHLVKV